eukprot:686230-Alexandrium_andersonii.AAC.1
MRRACGQRSAASLPGKRVFSQLELRLANAPSLTSRRRLLRFSAHYALRVCAALPGFMARER